MLAEDEGAGDVTTQAMPDEAITAVVKSRNDGILSGSAECRLLAEHFKLTFTSKHEDGDKIVAGDEVFTLHGSSHKILTLERTLLNILSRMSGVASLTREYVDAAGGKVGVLATRKTTPLFRAFEKRAVVDGGGLTHRMGLYDMVLVKDNHVLLCGGDVSKAVKNAKDAAPEGMNVEVEVIILEGALAAIGAGADTIMLDNLPPNQVKEIVDALTEKGLRTNVKIEASGGIRLGNVADYAETGVDYVSTGELTSNPKPMDFSLTLLK